MACRSAQKLIILLVFVFLLSLHASSSLSQDDCNYYEKTRKLIEVWQQRIVISHSHTRRELRTKSSPPPPKASKIKSFNVVLPPPPST
ncbi:hypothetical protein QVD17_03994 [Tagetes erecta]|uniref:Transmembrane protein n=1 Tax=Tagetes erecta TaxID=13708 RepID=A0AAD8LCB0_TARER|nr:hypothetical protein QVD17_03994 [Tagetes erecta]